MTSLQSPGVQQHASPRTTALAERARRVIPGGVNSSTRANGRPEVIVEAAGAHVTDADGHRYLDYHAAFGAILLGHRYPEVEEAVARSSQGPDLTGYGVSELEVELAELLTEAIPSVEQTFLLNTGSEAVAYAVRLARAATGRRYLVKFQGGFHGWSDPVARNVISPRERAYGLDPLSAGILPDALEATLIAEFNDIDSVRRLFDEHPDEIAAVILEPIPHNVGALIPDQSFVEELRSLTSDRGSLLIFDEVITGFRHALGGYQSICGVNPDLTTFGKALGNGYPIAGLGGSREILALADVTQGGPVAVMGTFNGNATSVAAGLATVRHLGAHPDFYERTHRLGQKVRTGLQQALDEREVKAQVVGFGGTFSTYFGIEGAAGYRTLLHHDNEASIKFHRGMIDRGFLMIPLPLKRMHVSGSFTDDDIDQTLAAARDTLDELAAQDALPRR